MAHFNLLAHFSSCATLPDLGLHDVVDGGAHVSNTFLRDGQLLAIEIDHLVDLTEFGLLLIVTTNGPTEGYIKILLIEGLRQLLVVELHLLGIQFDAQDVLQSILEVVEGNNLIVVEVHHSERLTTGDTPRSRLRCYLGGDGVLPTLLNKTLHGGSCFVSPRVVPEHLDVESSHHHVLIVAYFGGHIHHVTIEEGRHINIAHAQLVRSTLSREGLVVVDEEELKALLLEHVGEVLVVDHLVHHAVIPSRIGTRLDVGVEVLMVKAVVDERTASRG